MASLVQVRRPVLFCPSSCLVNLEGLTRKADLFLALSLRLLLWLSALHRVRSSFRRIVQRSLRPSFSTSPAFLLPSEQFQFFPETLDSLCSVVRCICRWCRLNINCPKFSTAQMFKMMVTIVFSRQSTPPLAVPSKTWFTSSLNCCPLVFFVNWCDWILGRAGRASRRSAGVDAAWWLCNLQAANGACRFCVLYITGKLE